MRPFALDVEKKTTPQLASGRDTDHRRLRHGLIRLQRALKAQSRGSALRHRALRVRVFVSEEDVACDNRRTRHAAHHPGPLRWRIDQAGLFHGNGCFLRLENKLLADRVCPLSEDRAPFHAEVAIGAPQVSPKLLAPKTLCENGGINFGREVLNCRFAHQLHFRSGYHLPVCQNEPEQFALRHIDDGPGSQQGRHTQRPQFSVVERPGTADHRILQSKFIADHPSLAVGDDRTGPVQGAGGFLTPVQDQSAGEQAARHR